jgi:auxin efflux carrier family
VARGLLRAEEQRAGINHFVATYALPALIFDMVSTNDPYNMDGRLVAADTLQKAATLLGLLAWAAWSSSRHGKTAEPPLRWAVTGFSVAQLPSTGGKKAFNPGL